MSPNNKNIVIWVLRILVAGLFAFAGFMKLSGQPMMVQEFDVVGLGDWFRIFTGLVEIVGAAAVLYPVTTAWGALLLLCVDVGAFIAQVTRIHQDWVHTIVIGAVVAGLLYLTQSAIQNRFGSAKF
jgi:putative oxidoreductase